MEAVLLRQWRDADLDPFAAMNADPEGMRYFPALLSGAESAVAMEKMRRRIDERGWGLWAVEVDGVFAGFTGLSVPEFSAPFMPCTEIGWRLRKEFWGRGIAFRAAKQTLTFGFESLKLREIVSFTAAINAPSRRLMERLGFQRDAGCDFKHPLLPNRNALELHVFYRLQNPANA